MNDDDLSIDIGEILDYNVKDIDMLAPLILAYIGDAVYDIYIRTILLQERVTPVHQMHKRAINYVKAEAQAKVVHALWDKFSEKEKGIIKRGRNAKSATVPKNADIANYRYATGFEALLGYLYLKKEFKRLKCVLADASGIIKESLN